MVDTFCICVIPKICVGKNWKKLMDHEFWRWYRLIRINWKRYLYSSKFYDIMLCGNLERCSFIHFNQNCIKYKGWEDILSNNLWQFLGSILSQGNNHPKSNWNTNDYTWNERSQWDLQVMCNNNVQNTCRTKDVTTNRLLGNYPYISTIQYIMYWKCKVSKKLCPD